MRFGKRGKPTSAVEVTNVSKHGFWLLTGRGELFAAFEDFPWFREASIGELLNVESPRAGHLYWPELDVDLALESLENPAAFPLVSRVRRRRSKRSATKR
jgi:hypothetical protein